MLSQPYLPPENFYEAKKLLLTIYAEHPFTFYCDCPFDPFTKTVERSSFLSENTPEDLLKLQWEHIVPASALGRNLSCWDKTSCPLKARSNRQCCQKTSKEFQLREANLYNLVPAIKLSNAKRSDYKPGIIEDKSRAIRVCRLLIDKKKRIMEPDDDLKGFIARTYLKIDQFYQINLSDRDKLLFQQWDMMYPEGAWERRRRLLFDKIYGLHDKKENSND